MSIKPVKQDALKLNTLTFWQWYIVLVWSYRYVRLVGNIIGHVLYKSIPLPDKASYSFQDVTVIISTTEDDMNKLSGPVSSILATNVQELFIVTTSSKYHTLQLFAKLLNDARVAVYQSEVANKRRQLCEAIPEVETDITILIDDGVTWPKV